MHEKKRQNHLEFYMEHGIAPVSYDLSSINAHLDRRESLYNALALPPLAIRGSKVLEVAAGTGQNSIYISAQIPETLILLEPNPTATKCIMENYSLFNRHHVSPVIVTSTLEDFVTGELFDIVICENWLGNTKHELDLLRKLGTLLRPTGMLIVTVVSPIGFVPNLLRRFLAAYLAPSNNSFDQRTGMLQDAFTSHLMSLASMTRNARDWVHDNMLNPAYFGLCLSVPLLISILEENFEVVEAFPRFEEDWRWFKGLHGEFRQRNEHFLEEYWRKCHNYIDSNSKAFALEATQNQLLEGIALSLLKAIEDHEDAHLQGGNVSNSTLAVHRELKRFIDCLPKESNQAHSALLELEPLVMNPSLISIKAVAEMKNFSNMFGRETSYVSMMKRRI